MTAPVITSPVEQLVILELPVAAWCPNGVVTLRALAPGLGAVLERLEYGAGKHPDERWRRQSRRDHVLALDRHADALVVGEQDVTTQRRHLAAIACRALMALTVGDEDEQR